MDWEHDPDFDGEPMWQLRERAVDWQLHEAERLALEFALLRPGTQPSEIKQKHVQAARRVFLQWQRLYHELQRRRRGERKAGR